MTIGQTYDKYHKILLVIPAVVLLLSIVYLGVFYSQNGDIIHKDVSLTGGTTITIFASDVTPEQMTSALSKNFQNLEVRSLSDNTGKQTRLIVTVQGDSVDFDKAIEKVLGYKLTSENSSKETTTSSLSGDFYKQLIISVILAFFWMAAVVFLIYAKGGKVKFWTVVLNLILGFLLGALQRSSNSLIYIVVIAALLVLLIYIYIKNSVPSFAVMSCAFADIIMTLALVDFMGMQLSSAGIVAFLMLIGYSVDTDILLTTRVVQRKKSINQETWEAFKTGMTMTLTAIAAIGTSLIVVYQFGSLLNQVFTILLIGLGFDILNTWITNASIIKWYAESKSGKQNG